VSADVSERLREIETQARKAQDALWHAAEAIGQRSPDRRDLELRLTDEALNKIIELARV
jgi:hypothetical protein